MNKIVLANIIFLLLLSAYLLVANLGLFGISFSYQQTSYSPWRSHFWPRANYEILEDKTIKLKQATWLDLNLPLMFQRATVKVQGENLENLELAWKAGVDDEVLLLSVFPENGYLELDLSEISQPHYLVFSIKENTEFLLENLEISFSYPRWFYDFKKNMLE